MAPEVGIEPTQSPLTAERPTVEHLWNDTRTGGLTTAPGAHETAYSVVRELRERAVHWWAARESNSDRPSKNRLHCHCASNPFGGSGGIRTLIALVKSQVILPLIYAPAVMRERDVSACLPPSLSDSLVGAAGFEPTQFLGGAFTAPWVHQYPALPKTGCVLGANSFLCRSGSLANLLS